MAEPSRSAAPVRLAILVSHPIQYHVHLFRRLAREPWLDLRVFFYSDMGATPYRDSLMGVDIRWAGDLLAGYDHVFLEGARGKRTFGFFGMSNPDLLAKLGAFRPDALLVYGYGSVNNIKALLWARRYGVRTLLQSDSQLATRRSLLVRAIKRPLLRGVYALVDRFMAVGERNGAYHRHYGARPGQIVPMPFAADEDAIAAAAEQRAAGRAALRERLGLAPDAFVGLFVGKLYDGKRPQDVVEALCLLRDRGKRFAVAFAGDGELMAQLRERAAETGIDAHFLGFVNTDALPGLYAAVDCAMQISRADAYGLVCVEASCAGLPLIVTREVGAVGPADHARPGENALVVPVACPAALADAIAVLAEDDDLRARMARRSREIFDTLDLRAAVRGIRRAIGASAGA